MNFDELKKKAIEFKEKSIKKATDSLLNSSNVIKTKEDLQKIIEDSKNKEFISQET
jgi:hypothetical protein